MEEDSFALFVDNSGSVGTSQSYWSTVSDIIAQYSKDISYYYLWNSECKLVTKKEVENSIKILEGTGGTSPDYVAERVVQKRHTKIILVTDGQVSTRDVQRCDQIFEKAKQNHFTISKSVCYIISTSGADVNMSVTCPFTRYCDNQVFKKINNQPLKAVAQFTIEDFKILDTLDEITLDNFEQKYDLIEGLIIALNMGKSGNIPLKNQLVIMKNRLIKELSLMMSKQMDYSKDIRTCLEKKSFEGAIEIASIMTNKYFSQDGTMSLEKKISHLINLCGDLRGKYNIGQIKSNRLATAAFANQAQIDSSVEMQHLSKQLIECPIIMDEDVPQILVDECQPFLLGVEKYIVDDIAACPLRILNYPDLKAKFKSSLSTFTGVKLTDKLLKNPFTQNRLLGAIPLGTHQSHIQVGNYTIAKLITGGKILGNLNLYYAVIWYLINEGEIQYLNPIKYNATEHLIYRLKTTKTTASLCGLAQFVTTQLDSDIAIWYCVSSGYLNQPGSRDTFRFHQTNMDPMIEIVRTLGFPIHQGTIPHLKRTKVLIRLLARFKQLAMNERNNFKSLINGLFQNGFFLGEEELTTISPRFRQLEMISEFIPIDGEASPLQIARIKQKLPRYCDDISNEEVYYLSTLLDAQKSASDILLDYNIKIQPPSNSLIHWCYGLGQHDLSQIKYNPRTMRPVYCFKDYQTWQDHAKSAFKVSNVNKLFSGCHYLQQYVLKYRKKPVYIELLQFYYNRYIVSGKSPTLPYLIQEWTQQLINRFNEVAQGQTIEQIIDIINSSVTIKSREFMQKFIKPAE